jgi:hypothetical protein
MNCLRKLCTATLINAAGVNLKVLQTIVRSLLATEG